MRYLIAALAAPSARGEVIEIGGPDVHLYPSMIIECAGQLGLRRWKLPLPIYPLELSARVVDLLSPVPLDIARPLMQELVGPSVITNPGARRLFPDIQPMTYAEAVRRALLREEMPFGTPWMGSLITRAALNHPHVRTRGEGFFIDYQETLFDQIPVGTRRFADGTLGGNQPHGWTVLAGKAGAWVRLEAQRRLPGRLYVEIERKENALRRAVLFEPRGLPGYLAGWAIVARTRGSAPWE
jgi:hypothetical protein